jgi:hypothetical protein
MHAARRRYSNYLTTRSDEVPAVCCIGREMDCSLPSVCGQTFTACADQQGQSEPLADKLLACMNGACATP